MMLAILLAVQDDVEAKEKRLAALVAEAIEIAEKVEGDPESGGDPEIAKRMESIRVEGDALLKELTGGDKKKEDEVIDAALRKHNPEAHKKFLRMKSGGNERNASVSLRSIVVAQENFRSNDIDRNWKNDYWVADVSGLYRIVAGENPIQALSDIGVARADAAPAVPHDKEGEAFGMKLAEIGAGAPKAGYHYAAIAGYEEQDGKVAAYDGGDGRNAARFAVCAYPAEYGVTGTMTFIVSESASVWKKDTEGKRIDTFPADPEKAGWKRP